MRNMIKKWWNKERINRVEKGTSQDMCPTNGDTVIWFIVCSLGWIVILLMMIFKKS